MDLSAVRPFPSSGEGGRDVRTLGDVFKRAGLLGADPGGVKDKLDTLKLYLLSVKRLNFFLLAASLTTVNQKHKSDLRL